MYVLLICINVLPHLLKFNTIASNKQKKNLTKISKHHWGYTRKETHGIPSWRIMQIMGMIGASLCGLSVEQLKIHYPKTPEAEIFVQTTFFR